MSNLYHYHDNWLRNKTERTIQEAWELELYILEEHHLHQEVPQELLPKIDMKRNNDYTQYTKLWTFTKIGYTSLSNKVSIWELKQLNLQNILTYTKYNNKWNQIKAFCNQIGGRMQFKCLNKFEGLASRKAINGK